MRLTERRLGVLQVHAAQHFCPLSKHRPCHCAVHCDLPCSPTPPSLFPGNLVLLASGCWPLVHPIYKNEDFSCGYDTEDRLHHHRLIGIDHG